VAEPSALGIDLGTTFSVVAQVNEAGLPVVLPNAEGSPTTPSVVLFDAGQAVVGAVARESLATEPESVVQLAVRGRARSRHQRPGRAVAGGVHPGLPGAATAREPGEA
jgi:molecular chaperone DnaK (HSP70)